MSFLSSTCNRSAVASRTKEQIIQAGDRAVSVQECLKAEEADRETMKQEWSTFSASGQEALYCRSHDGRQVELYRTCHMSRNGAGRQSAEKSARWFQSDRLTSGPRNGVQGSRCMATILSRSCRRGVRTCPRAAFRAMSVHPQFLTFGAIAPLVAKCQRSRQFCTRREEPIKGKVNHSKNSVLFDHLVGV